MASDLENAGRESNSGGPLRVSRASFRFGHQPMGNDGSSSAEEAANESSQTESGSRDDALAASGWRASKEIRMPVANNRPNFKQLWRACSDSDQCHYDGYDQERNHGVHDEANRTVVGGAYVGMPIGYVDHCQQHDYDEAHCNRHPQSARPWTMIVSVLCQNCRQHNILNKIVHRNAICVKTL